MSRKPTKPQPTTARQDHRAVVAPEDARARGWREGTEFPCTLANALLMTLGDGVVEIAAQLGLPQYRVRDWLLRGRIAPTHWDEVLASSPPAKRRAIGADLASIAEDYRTYFRGGAPMSAPEKIRPHFEKAHARQANAK